MKLVFIKTIVIKKFVTPTLVLALLLLLVRVHSATTTANSFPVTSWALANRVIVIDPGHGGLDPGAVKQGIKEKDIVLQVSKQLAQFLSQAGARVLLTRESDTDLSSGNQGSLLSRKRDDLNKRVELANKNNADLYISIHVNAFPSGKWRGAQTFYQKNNEESKKLGEAVQSELIRIMQNTTRVAKPEDFYATRNTKMPSNIVEIGFLSNPAEASLMTNKAYQRKLAYAIYSGLVKYYAGQLPQN